MVAGRPRRGGSPSYEERIVRGKTTLISLGVFLVVAIAVGFMVPSSVVAWVPPLVAAPVAILVSRAWARRQRPSR
jgi:hypothetical protein